MKKSDLPNGLQKIEHGYGAEHHRVYKIELPAKLDVARKAFQHVIADISRFSPKWLAKFEKAGEGKKLNLGDKFQIFISGPWNGPVVVTELKKDHFRFHTLKGHLEAGYIDFDLKTEAGKIYLVIESYARSKNFWVDLWYDKLKVAKFAQSWMWDSFCQAVAQLSLDLSKEKDCSPLECQITSEKRDKNSKKWKKA